MTGADTPKRKVGIVKGCLTLGVFGFLILCLIAVFLPKGPTPDQPTTTPTPAVPTVASPQPAPVPAPPPPDTLAPVAAFDKTSPTPEEAEGDTIRGLTQARRKEIYAAYHQAGMRASRLAESRYPLGNIPTDEGEAKRHVAEHKKVYDATKKQGRREVLKQYKIDGAQLDAIEREGSEKKWPLGEE